MAFSTSSHVTLVANLMERLTRRDNSVEQREYSRMASVVVNTHECEGMANRVESFVPKFVGDVEVVGELVSRREYSAQRAPLNRSR